MRGLTSTKYVIAGLDPAIRGLGTILDARIKSGHDAMGCRSIAVSTPPAMRPGNVGAV